MTSMQTDLAHPADIVTRPEKAVADYLISKKIRAEIVKKLPDWDVACDSPDTNLVVAKRDLTEAKCILNTEKAIYDAKTKGIDEKWEELRQKQYELRDAFTKNNKVIKKNYEERQRSEKQIAEEEAEQKRIQVDINDLEKQLQKYKAAEAKMSEKVAAFKIYEEYLQKVIDAYPEYNCIDDILNRYESLIETREEMKELQMRSVNQVEKIRQDVELLTEENVQEMYELNENLSELRIKKYHVQIELAHWAQAIEKLRDLGSRDYLEITNAIEGIWLLYLNVCTARKQTPQFDKSCLQEQLKYIVDNMTLLHEVLGESKRYLKRSKQNYKGCALPSARELDKWSTDYERFQSINSIRAQASKK